MAQRLPRCAVDVAQDVREDEGGMATKKVKIDQLKPDLHNANKGTLRGRKALDHSLRQLGAGRSVLIDKNGNVIAGNKTVETAADIGLEDVIIVQTDGHQLVAVQRTDLDLETDKAARELAYADNRVGQLDLDWEPDELKIDLDAGLDLSQLFEPYELRMIGVMGEVDNPEDHWKGMPEFIEEDLSPFRTIKVHFKNENDLIAFEEMIGYKISAKNFIWYPPADILHQSLVIEND